MKLSGRIFFLFFVTVILFANTVFGFNNESGGGHLTITDKAAQLRLEASSDKKFQDWIKYEALPYFLTGTHDEDCTKYGSKNDNDGNPIPDNCRLQGPNSNQWGNFFEHFYNPQTGAGLGHVFIGQYRTAIARAKDYEKIIKAFICATRSGKYDDLSPVAKTYVNDYFGRIQHLIEDMGVSYHTKLEPHWPIKPIEDYVKNNWDTIVTSKLFEMELAETSPVIGACIDPTAPMFKLAAWSYGRPNKNQYWTCSNDIPTQGQASCIYNQAKLEANATMMAARATKFASSYIDQIYNAINTDCVCKDEPPSPKPDHPDDNFDVSALIKDTQFVMSGYDLLDFYMRLALKKGNMAPIYAKQLMEIYAEARALPADATEEQKSAAEQKITEIDNKLNVQPVKDIDTSPDVVILENGYYMQMTALINKNEEPVRNVPVGFSPEIVKDHPVLVIPSAGLYGMEKSAVFKASLDEYVKQGGTLVVFSQQHGYEFEILPVPQETDGTYRTVKGYGWVEDQSCFANSVYTDTYHQMLSGQSRATPSFNVDGYFTNYPSNTTVVLRRTINGQPAMIMYEYGQGRVIATSMYSDFAYGSSQASSEEIAFIRDLISWAKKPVQLPEKKPGENIIIPVSVNSVVDTGASQIRFQLYSPGRSQLISEQTVSTGLAAHVSTDITLQYTAPVQIGIYHIDYILLDAQGNIIQPQTETDSGRFAVSNPPANPYKSSDFNFSATTATDRVPYGDDALFTVHMWNNTSQSRTVTAKYVFPHMYMQTGDPSYGVYRGFQPGSDNQWLTKTVIVGANNNVNFDHAMKNAIHDEFIYANFYDENNKYLGSATAGFFLFFPSADVTLQTDKTEYARGETVTITALASSRTEFPFTASAKFTIIASDSTTVFEDVKKIAVPFKGTIPQSVSFVLPASLRTGYYRVHMDLECGTQRIMSADTTFDIPSSDIRAMSNLPEVITVGTNIFSFTVKNMAAIPANFGALDVSLSDPEGNVVYSGNLPFVLQPGESKDINIPVLIAALKLGNYTLEYNQSDGTWRATSTKVTIPNNIILSAIWDKLSYRVRETGNLTVTLMNTGNFAFENILASVSIPDINFVDTKNINISKGQSIAIPFSFLIPEDIPAGTHEVLLTAALPSGSSTTQTLWILVPESKLVIEYSGTAPVNLRDTLSFTIENNGGVDTEIINGNIYIKNREGKTLSIAGFDGAVVRMGEKKVLGSIQIPDQSPSGNVYISIETKDISGKVVNFGNVLYVRGLSAELITKTDKDAYLTIEQITGITDINNTGLWGIEDGMLHLTVYRNKIAGSDNYTSFLPLNGWLSSSRLNITGTKDGYVYILGPQRLLKYDTNGNKITEWADYHEGGIGIFDGDGITSDADGHVYIYDNYNYQIRKFDGNGNLITQWECANAGQLYSVSGMATGPDGYIYVADSQNNQIRKFDGNGQIVMTWGSPDGDGQIQLIDSIAVGPDNTVYVFDYSLRSILKFDNNGNFIKKWGSRGIDPGQFSSLSSLAVSPDGFVYATDSWNSRIQKFDGNGNLISLWMSSDNSDNWISPEKIAIDNIGRIYVAQEYSSNNDIYIYDSGGNYLTKWAKRSDEPGHFSGPVGIAMDSVGSLYVADTGNNRIQKFDGSGNFVKILASSGYGDGQVDRPASIAVDKDGYIYIADTGNNRIQKLDSDGNFVMEIWGVFDIPSTYLDSPLSVAVHTDGSLFIADTGNNRILKFDGNNNFVKTWGSVGSANGQFNKPSSIAVDKNGSVYVADTENNRIQKFDLDGNLVTTWGSFGEGNGQFVYPKGVAIGRDGVVLVSDTIKPHSEWVVTGCRIQQFDSDGNFLESRGSMGDGEGAFNNPTGIAVNDDNVIYIADTDNDRIQMLGFIKRENLYTVDILITQPGNTTGHYPTDIGILDATGKLFLEAILINNSGQEIARSVYPFYVVKDNLFVTFSTDKKKYKPGEMVTIHGVIKNGSSIAADGITLDLMQQSSAGAEVLYSLIADLPASGSYPFTTTLQTDKDGTYVLTGKISQNAANLFEASDVYEVVSPKVSAMLSSPDNTGNNPFAVTIELINTGKIDATIDLASSIDNQKQTIIIPVGETKSLSYQQQISQDTMYTFTLSGAVDLVMNKTVHFGASLYLWEDALDLYPEGLVNIPVFIGNDGAVDDSITIDFSLQPTGTIFQKTYFIPQWGGVDDTVSFNLAEGDYDLTISSQAPAAALRTTFSVRKEINLTMTNPVITTGVDGAVTVSTEFANQGSTDFTGSARMSIVGSNGVAAWQSAQDLSLLASQIPTPQRVAFSLNHAAIPTGVYSIVVEATGSNGAVISSRSIPYTVQGAKIVLSQVPTPISVNLGEQTTFVFRVTNTGGKEGFAELKLKAYDLMNFTKQEWVAPGETKEITISFLAPMDLEEKDYFADYELKDETATVVKGQIKYHLNGINIGVNATLDKQNYRDRDTAHLTLTISSRTLFQPVNCFAKANYGGYEEKKDFSLSGATTLTFDVPLTKITGDKLAFGVYLESGRSIHLNSLYIYKTGEVFTITTNKQVYNQGETGMMTITGNQSGAMTINGPGNYSETFSFAGNATKSFTLPATATAGAYPIEAHLTLATGEVVSSTHPIDIMGIQVKVKEATLDKGKYAASDTMKLFLKIESNTNMAALLKVWTTYPDGTSKYIGEKAINLATTEPLIVSGEYPLTTHVSGIHKLVYGVYGSDLLLASGPEVFDVGDAVLLGIATDKADYPLGTEPVSVKANMYGTTAASLLVEIDGVNVKTESVSLGGFSKIDIPLDNVLPGAHTLKATLTAGGLSSVKETGFTYGSSLADLVPDVWGSVSSIGKDTSMKLSVSVTNQGKITSTPTTLTLFDGDTLLSTFSVEAIATGEIKSFEYLLQAMGKAGEHSFKVVIDPANSVAEFNRENNTVIRKITIPDIISFTDTPNDTYRMIEQIPVSTTIINLTQSTFYPNLTISTVAKDGTGVEVFRKSSPFGAPPSRSSLFNDVWAPVNLAEGTYTIAQTIMDGNATLAQSTKTLTLLQGSGFVISVNKDNFALRQGETTSLIVSVEPLAGWTGFVNFFVEGVPSGTNISSNPAGSVYPPGNIIMNIVTTETTPASTHTFTIVAEGVENGISSLQSIPVTFMVSGFGIAAVPQSLTIRQLETATFVLSASSLNGYEGSITLSQQGGPIKGIAASIDKPNMVIPDETVLRIQTSKFTQPGNYTITLAAGDGVLVRKVDLPLIVVENTVIAPGLILTPGPGYENPAIVTLVSRSFVPVLEFAAFSTKFGANAVMGDIDGDGEDEIIIAPGPDPRAEGKLRIYRKNGVFVLEKKIFNSHFGLNLAVGDIDGDLKEEIIVGTGPDLLTAPRIKVLSWNGSDLVETGIDFAPYPKETNCIFCDIIQLGVHLATADIDGDGILEIITGPGPSIFNKAHVKVFKFDTSAGIGNWRVVSILSDFAVKDGSNNHFLFGINIAAGDTDGDALPEIITGLGPYSPYAPTVKVYEVNGTSAGVSFNAFSDIQGHPYQSGFGVYVAARDLNGDGLAEIITGTGPSPFNSSWVRIFKGNGSLLNNGFLAYPEHMHYGVKVSTGNVGE
jgi:sugar lactone lactonase YvrE